MAQMKLFGKDIKAYDDINVDELLATLTDAELEELGQELIDPDDSCIPPSERCRYKTDKKPTGPFNRKALLDFIERKAREEKDWDEAKPFKKEIRGKVWLPKAVERTQVNDDIEVDTEWDEVLNNATEEELVDLAAILGFHGMLNQTQYHQAFVENREILGDGAGFQGVAKHENFKLYEDDAPNTTDVDASLKQIKDNDPKLKELNLNNIKNISLERLIEFGKALKDNTHLEKFHLSNTKATDKVARAIAESLENNKTLVELNMESNYISGIGIVELLEAINKNQIVTELRVTNQRPAVLGNKIEMRIAELIRQNITILKFGIFLEAPGARIGVEEFLQRNNDNLRRGRVGTDLIPIPEPRQNKYLKQIQEDMAKRKAAVAAEPRISDTPAKDEKPKEEEEEEEEDEVEDDEDETESSEEEE